MDEYRLHFIDWSTGTTLAMLALPDCADEDSARDHMAVLARGRGVELWQAERRIAVTPRPKLRLSFGALDRAADPAMEPSACS